MFPHNIQHNFEAAAVRLQLHDFQAVGFAKCPELECRPTMIVVWCFVNAIEKWHFENQLPMRPQNARHLRPRHLRFLDMLHHGSRENSLERFSGEGQGPIQVDDFIDVLCAVEGAAPIDADYFRDEITIHSIKWDLAATVVEQPTLGVLLKQVLIHSHTMEPTKSDALRSSCGSGDSFQTPFTKTNMDGRQTSTFLIAGCSRHDFLGLVLFAYPSKPVIYGIQSYNYPSLAAAKLACSMP